MKLQDLEMYQQTKQNTSIDKKYYLVYARKSTESEDHQMQSIQDQLNEAERLAKNKSLNVTKTFTESRSAKQPGRIEFDNMVNYIYEQKNIKGIIVWKLNRLARNPKDEGTIRWLLQSGEIQEIVTPEKTYTSVDSDFLMAIEGAQAQRFISDLKKDSARGVNSKIEKGHAPQLAPHGYRNATEKRQGERDIQPHPQYFPLMRQIFDLMLTNNYSVEQLYHKSIGLGIRNSRNNLISRTQLYKCFRDPFYTGRFTYAGKLYKGAHQPMITDEEFDLIQEYLNRRNRPRVNTHHGFLNGVIKCGECGFMVTSEIHKKKLSNGKTKVFEYYRCTKKNREQKCSQPFINAEVLEQQALEYLSSVKLSTRFVEWATKWLKVMHQEQTKVRDASYTATEQEYTQVNNKLARLVDLMLDGAITPDEGKLKRQELEEQKEKLQTKLGKLDQHVSDWTTLAIETFDFVRTAQDKFTNGTNDQRKTILRVIGSNLVLKDKKLSIELRKPFAYIQNVAKEIGVTKIPQFPQDGDFAISSQSVWGE